MLNLYVFSELSVADQISAHFAELHSEVDDKVAKAEARAEARLKCLFGKMVSAQREQATALVAVREGIRRRITQTADRLRADAAIEHSVLEQRLEDEWRVVRGHAHGLNIRRQVPPPPGNEPKMVSSFLDGRDCA